MRKAILFLLLFGAGLTLLLWLRRPRPVDPGTPDLPVPSEVGEFTDVPLRDATAEDASKRVGVVLDGALEITQFAGEGSSRRPRLVLKATDVDAVGGDAYDMDDLDIELRDDASGAVRVHLKSPRSRVALTIVEGKPQLGAQDVVQLTQVDVDLYEGVPVVPLSAQVPLLQWEIVEQRMRSDDPVVIRGQGLQAHGTGFLVEQKAERFEFKKDGVLELDLRERGRATLSATRAGPLWMSRRVENTIERVDLVGEDGARLSVKLDETFTLDADRIHLVGTPQSGDSKTFVLESAEAVGSVVAESRGDRFRAQRARFAFAGRDLLTSAVLDGDVVLERGADVFHAEHAEFVFDERGQVTTSTLTGSPRGSLVIDVDPPKDRPELTRVKAEISGAGPLIVARRDEGTRVELGGPCRIDAPVAEFSIEATQRIEGFVQDDRTRGTFLGRGAVVAIQADARCAASRSISTGASARIASPSSTRAPAARRASTV